jgi:UDP:flavonoid glycosyltransferase YjiC (YdhE family)
VCHDAGGTVPPVLALTQSLVARGANVTILGQPSVERRALAAGAGFVRFSEHDDYDRTRSIEQQLERSLPVLAGASTGHDLRALAEEFRPDLVVVDANLTGALAAAEGFDVPSVVLLHSMYRTFVDVWLGEVWPLLETPINTTRQELGVDGVDSWRAMFVRHSAAMSVVTTELDAPVVPPLPNQHHFGFLVPTHDGPVGPALPVGDAPLALVSLSTTFQEEEHLLDRIMEAARPHARMIVTTAGYAPASASAPGTVVVDHVPHPAVLPSVDLVITHAGLGTVSAALAHGVPLVCAPLGRDQHLNADRVEVVGAGLGVAASAPVGDISATIELVLRDASFREGARRQSSLSSDEGGPRAAAAFIAGLAARGAR